MIKKTTGTPINNDLNRILHNAKALLKLVNQLLDFRRLEQQGEQLKLTPVQIKPFIENCVHQFRELAHEQNLTLVCDCSFPTNEIFNLDVEKIIRVMNNLLSNAIKFTPSNGIITVQAGWAETRNNGSSPTGIYINVCDTGIGIKSEDLKNIFVRFFQSDNGEENTLNTGSGIGLHLTKGYIDLHHGEITVESKPNEGTTFSIYLPYLHIDEQLNEEQTKNEGQSYINKEEFTKSHSHSEEKNENKKIKILVAEDNEQFRLFIKDLLHHEYDVLLATDGEEGFTLATQYNPDLIISDVMMPKMNGYEFCQAVKSDVKCSHIPFILLTAKNSSKSRTSAYEAGADSFIAKPFDIEVLMSRIHQLLEQRRKRQDLFRKDISITPKEITITPLDEQLIQKALECIEKNMSNTEYNVEALSADMGIERSSLYRKMQAIVGLTPSEFMRTIRLKRAAQLLEQSQYSVQEISWMVGFNTPRYFSSYFKEMFGLNPSQYASEKHKKSK